MNRTKLVIVDTFWQLLEEKSYDYFLLGTL